MLDPLSPSYFPDKPSPEKPEKPIAEAKETSDSEGYRFNIYGRARNKKKKNSENQSSNDYNESSPVLLQLSDEAREKLKKQRLINELRKKPKG